MNTPKEHTNVPAIEISTQTGGLKPPVGLLLRTACRLKFERGFWDSRRPKLRPSPVRIGQLIYAHSQNATQGDLPNKESCVSNNDFLTSSLIRVWPPGPMTSHYGGPRYRNFAAWGNLIDRRLRMVKVAPRQVSFRRHIYQSLAEGRCG